MKKILLLISPVLFIACNSPKERKFSITTDETPKVDTVLAGKKISFPIFIENSTEKNVIIEDIAQSCTCTSITLQKGTIIEADTKKNYVANVNTDTTYRGKIINVVLSIRASTNPSIFTIEKNYYLN